MEQVINEAREAREDAEKLLGDGETEPHDLEDYLFRIHFREEEIERVKEAQDRKMFDELLEEKYSAVEFARLIGGA